MQFGIFEIFFYFHFFWYVEFVMSFRRFIIIYSFLWLLSGVGSLTWFLLTFLLRVQCWGGFHRKRWFRWGLWWSLCGRFLGNLRDFSWLEEWQWYHLLFLYGFYCRGFWGKVCLIWGMETCSSLRRVGNSSDLVDFLGAICTCGILEPKGFA